MYKNLFKEVAALDDVKGIFLFSREGKLIFQDTMVPTQNDIGKEEWLSTFNVIKDLKEIELIYEQEQVYIRSTKRGYLLIRMGKFAPLALIKLNCNVLIPALEEIPKKRTIGRLFKRR